MIISFDFDGTLCWVNKSNISIFRRNIKVFNIFKKHVKNNDQIIIVTFRNPENETEELKIKEKRVLINDFKANLSKSLKTRFIRVEAINIGVCPEWHPGKGQKAWIFADEILVH